MIGLRSLEFPIQQWFATGDMSFLLAYLRSDNPLSSDDRNKLADILDGKLKLPQRRPPQALTLERMVRLLPMLAAAAEVDRLKKQWRKSGIPAGTTKRQAPRAAIEIAAKQFKVDPDDLAVRMRLPLAKRYL